MTKQQWKRAWSKARFYIRYDVLFGMCSDQLALKLLVKRNQPDPLPITYKLPEMPDVPF